MKKISLDQLDKKQVDLIEPFHHQFEGILKLMHLEVFSPEEYIVKFNEDIHYLRFIVQGKAKIMVVHEDGKQSIIHFAKKNEFIGELSFIGIEDVSKDVIAIDECICLSIPMIKAKETLINNADFLLLTNRYIGNKLLERTWFNSKNQNYELKNRLAAYILMTEYDGCYKEKHTETAEYLGISYRHLLHTFKSFIENDLLKKVGKGYELNIEGLMLLAKDIYI